MPQRILGCLAPIILSVLPLNILTFLECSYPIFVFSNSLETLPYKSSISDNINKIFKIFDQVLQT